MYDWHTSISWCRSTSVSHTSSLHFTKVSTFSNLNLHLWSKIIMHPKKMLNDTLEQQRTPTHWRQASSAQFTGPLLCGGVADLFCWQINSSGQGSTARVQARARQRAQLSPGGRRALSRLPTSYCWTAHWFVLPGYYPVIIKSIMQQSYTYENWIDMIQICVAFHLDYQGRAQIQLIQLRARFLLLFVGKFGKIFIPPLLKKADVLNGWSQVWS